MPAAPAAPPPPPNPPLLTGGLGPAPSPWSPWRYDWYQASLHGMSCDEALHALQGIFPAALQREVRPLKGYVGGLELYQTDGGRAEMERCLARLYVGSTGGIERPPHCLATGAAAPALADGLSGYAKHVKVSRIDVARDTGGGRHVWATVVRLATQHLADRPGRAVRQLLIFDPTGAGGGTLMLGSPTSPICARIYEKGLHPDAPLQAIPPDAVRFELQIRPASALKAAAAQMTPEQAASCGGWVADVLQAAAGIGVAPDWHPGLSYRQTDHARAMAALVSQYGATLEREAEMLGGDWSALGQNLKAAWQDERRRRRIAAIERQGRG